MYTHTSLQASGKGVSTFVIGVIVGITPLAVTIFAPIIGYMVSKGTKSTVKDFCTFAKKSVEPSKALFSHVVQTQKLMIILWD